VSTLPVTGDVVEVTGLLPGDPDPLPIGQRGTVTHVSRGRWPQISVRWHNSTRSLMLLPEDPFKII
jgi:hypothetical protein